MVHKSWCSSRVDPLFDEKNATFFFCCWLFPPPITWRLREKLERIGAKNYRKVPEKTTPMREYHPPLCKSSTLKVTRESLIKGQTIATLHQKQLINERGKALQTLDRIFSVTLFFILRGLPFRRHRIESQKIMMTKYDQLWLLKLSARQNKYTSPKSQNGVIDFIATVVRGREKCSMAVLVTLCHFYSKDLPGNEEV